MSTDTQLPQDHPLMKAWEAHKQTPEYASSRAWVTNQEHVDGSLWALFMAGWMAARESAVDAIFAPGGGLTECDMHDDESH